MLAFNLGVFFRNLQGEDVTFSARNDHCEVHFVGGVEALHEQTDLTRHLSVTLSKGDLSCRMAFEEDEEPETPESADVEVRLVQVIAEREVLLLQTRFRFEEIQLKPGAAEEATVEGTGPRIN